MQRKNRRFFSSWVLAATFAVLASLGNSQEVMAQQPDGKAASEQEITRQVVELIREAKALQAENKNAEALSKYEKAYALKPLPALLYPMGQTAAAAGQNAKAIDYYEKFVKALPNEKAAERVASEDLPALKAKMPAKLTVASNPEGAKVYLSDDAGEPVGVTPYEGEVEPGKVTVILKREGFEKYSEELTLEGMGEGAVNATLARVQVTEVTEPEVPEEKSGNSLRAVGFGVTGVGVALLATGGTFSVLSMNRTNQVNDYDKSSAASGPVGRAEIEDLKDQANSFYRTSLVTYIAGGVITAVGVGTLAYGMTRGGSESEAGAESARRTKLQFGVGRQGAFLGLRRAF